MDYILGRQKNATQPKQAAKRAAESELPHDTNTIKKLKFEDVASRPSTTTTAISARKVREAASKTAAALVKTDKMPWNTDVSESTLFKDSTVFRKLYATGQVVKPNPIHITATAAPEDFEPTGLTPSSSRLYKEGIPYFYRDNTFVLQVKDYDIRAFLPWLDRATQYRTDAPCDGTITIALSGAPHWENLVEWLELVHGMKVTALDDNCEDDTDEVKVVKGAFAQVMALRAYKWKDETELILGGMRTMLAALDPSWDEDHPEVDAEDHEADAVDAGSQDGLETMSVARDDQDEEALANDGPTTPRGSQSPSLGEDVPPTQATYRTAIEQQLWDEGDEDVAPEGSIKISTQPDAVKSEVKAPLTPASTPAPMTPQATAPSQTTSTIALPTRQRHPRKARLQSTYRTDQPEHLIKEIGSLPKNRLKGMNKH